MTRYQKLHALFWWQLALGRMQLFEGTFFVRWEPKNSSWMMWKRWHALTQYQPRMEQMELFSCHSLLLLAIFIWAFSWSFLRGNEKFSKFTSAKRIVLQLFCWETCVMVTVSHDSKWFYSMIPVCLIVHVTWSHIRITLKKKMKSNLNFFSTSQVTSVMHMLCSFRAFVNISLTWKFRQTDIWTSFRPQK